MRFSLTFSIVFRNEIKYIWDQRVKYFIYQQRQHSLWFLYQKSLPEIILYPDTVFIVIIEKQLSLKRLQTAKRSFGEQNLEIQSSNHLKIKEGNGKSDRKKREWAKRVLYRSAALTQSLRSSPQPSQEPVFTEENRKLTWWQRCAEVN